MTPTEIQSRYRKLALTMVQAARYEALTGRFAHYDAASIAADNAARACLAEAEREAAVLVGVAYVGPTLPTALVLAICADDASARRRHTLSGNLTILARRHPVAGAMMDNDRMPSITLEWTDETRPTLRAMSGAVAEAHAAPLADEEDGS